MNKCYLDISRSNFISNINYIKNITNSSIMPIIKANGYGTYINKDLSLLNMFSIVGVSSIDEGKSIRNIGYRGDILVLFPVISYFNSSISKYDFIYGIDDNTNLDIFNNYDVRVHIRVDTGMGRVGLRDNLDEFKDKLIRKNNLKVEGIYTHLSSVCSDNKYTMKQIDKFNYIVNYFKEYFDFKYIHHLASSGILNLPIGISNLVRPGIIMFGYSPDRKFYDKLKPVLKLRSKIIFIKSISMGDAIGYDRSFVSTDNMIIATVGMGYADGVPRSLASDGYVVCNGKMCKIIGSICMDNFMIDVTSLDEVNLNDDVYLFDNNMISLSDISNWSGLINYEILTGIGERVIRKYVD